MVYQTKLFRLLITMKKNTVVQLNKNNHSNLRLVNQLDASVFVNDNMLPIILHEMPQLATELPLVFVKNSQTGQFTLVALLGLVAQQNLLIDNAQWQGAYLPAIVTHFPLGLVRDQDDDDKFAVLINESSQLLSSDKGERLFDEQGEQTEYLNSRIEALQNYHQAGIITEEFVSHIAKINLLESKSLTYEVAGEKKNIGGIYLINERKLSQLTSAEFDELRNKDFLASIYSHIISIHNVRKLVIKANKKQL